MIQDCFKCCTLYFIIIKWCCTSWPAIGCSVLYVTTSSEVFVIHTSYHNMSIPSSETSAAVSIFPGIETQCLHGKTKKTPYQKKICPHNSFLSLFYSLTTDVSLVIFASAHFPPKTKSDRKSTQPTSTQNSPTYKT